MLDYSVLVILLFLFILKKALFEKTNTTSQENEVVFIRVCIVKRSMDIRLNEVGKFVYKTIL